MCDFVGSQRDLLGLEEPHRLAVKGKLENYYEKEIHRGRLYPNLDTLADKGIIEKGRADRRTNVYSVTRRGISKIEARRVPEQQSNKDFSFDQLVIPVLVGRLSENSSESKEADSTSSCLQVSHPITYPCSGMRIHDGNTRCPAAAVDDRM